MNKWILFFLLCNVSSIFSTFEDSRKIMVAQNQSNQNQEQILAEDLNKLKVSLKSNGISQEDMYSLNAVKNIVQEWERRSNNKEEQNLPSEVLQNEDQLNFKFNEDYDSRKTNFIDPLHWEQLDYSAAIISQQNTSITYMSNKIGNFSNKIVFDNKNTIHIHAKNGNQFSYVNEGPKILLSTFLYGAEMCTLWSKKEVNDNEEKEIHARHQKNIKELLDRPFFSMHDTGTDNVTCLTTFFMPFMQITENIDDKEYSLDYEYLKKNTSDRIKQPISFLYKKSMMEDIDLERKIKILKSTNSFLKNNDESIVSNSFFILNKCINEERAILLTIIFLKNEKRINKYLIKKIIDMSLLSNHKNNISSDFEYDFLKELDRIEDTN